MSEHGSGPARGGGEWQVPVGLVPEAPGRRMGAGDVTVLVVGVLLAVLGAATDLIVTWAGAMADTLGGWCRTNAGSVGCRYLGVWLYGPWVGLTLAVVVGIVLGHRRWARGRGTWPVLPIGLALYLPLVVLSILALS